MERLLQGARRDASSAPRIAAAPWRIVLANDKKVARLEFIRDLLDSFSYRGKSKKLTRPDRDIAFDGPPQSAIAWPRKTQKNQKRTHTRISTDAERDPDCRVGGARRNQAHHDNRRDGAGQQRHQNMGIDAAEQ